MSALLKTATCIGCGCTDDRACPGGCAWLRLNRHLRTGICSECEHLVGSWDAEGLVVALPARVRQSCGAYNATLGRARGSSTCSAQAAIERAVAKHVGGSRLHVVEIRLKQRLPGTAIEHWEVLVDPSQL